VPAILPEPVMNADEINAFIADIYPHLNGPTQDYLVTDVSPGRCSVRLNAAERHLRPGDTVSGPCLFTLADIGGYACVLAHIGREALAVTINLNITFMRKAGPGPVDGHTRLLKLGKSLIMFDIEIVAGEDKALIAHATGTYAVPPRWAVI